MIPFLFRADHKTEGEDKATVTIYEDKNRKKVLNKVSFPVLDTSIETPDQKPTKSVEPGKPQQKWGPYTKQGTWFTLSPSRPDIKENNSTRTRIDSNAKANRRLYFNITGKGINKDDLDLSYGRMEGEANTNGNGVALIPHLLRNDNNTEGTEEMTLTLYSDKKRRQYLTSTTIPILDTSVESPGHPPTKSVTPSKKQTVWDGGDVGGTWFTLSPNRPDYKDNELIKTRIDSDSLPGTVVYYELSGRGISAKSLDQSKGLGGMTGKASIEVNGLANIEHLIKEDESSYEDRELTISLYRDKKLTRKLASTTVPIDNITVEPGLRIEATSNKISEGQGVKLKTFTQGYDLDKTFYWDIQGVNITSEDFSTSNSLSGTAKRKAGNKKFTLDFKTSKDKFTEGQERFKLFIYSNPEKTDLMATSEEVVINDTSTTPLQTYDVFAKPPAVNEGKGFLLKSILKMLMLVQVFIGKVVVQRDQ